MGIWRCYWSLGVMGLVATGLDVCAGICACCQSFRAEGIQTCDPAGDRVATTDPGGEHWRIFISDASGNSVVLCAACNSCSDLCAHAGWRRSDADCVAADPAYNRGGDHFAGARLRPGPDGKRHRDHRGSMMLLPTARRSWYAGGRSRMHGSVVPAFTNGGPAAARVTLGWLWRPANGLPCWMRTTRWHQRGLSGCLQSLVRRDVLVADNLGFIRSTCWQDSKAWYRSGADWLWTSA